MLGVKFNSIGIYFIFGTKFFWNKGINSCSNVECVLLERNFDFLDRYLVVTGGLLLVTGGYSLLPLVTARSHF